MDVTKQIQLCKSFKNLHTQDGIFILGNAWDVLSARIFEESGYDAIGTTSAGIAATLGCGDGEKMDVRDYLNIVSRICNNINIPVNADFEGGYSNSINEIIANAELFIQAGIAGLNIEDENHSRRKSDAPLYPVEFTIEKILAIKALCIRKGIPLVINAKTDAYWLQAGKNKIDILHNVIKRANAYGEIGADCVFIPGDFNKDEIVTLAKEIEYPINLVIKKHTPSLMELKEIGIKRLSMGSGPYRASIGLTKMIAEEVQQKGTYRHILDYEIDYFDVSTYIKKPQ